MVIKKIELKTPRISIILPLVFFLFFLPQKVFAASVSSPTNVLSEVQVEQAFSVNGSLTEVQSGQMYFIKCRIGQSESDLSDGQTYNAGTGSWLSDTGSTGAWVDMPAVAVSDSTANFSIQCRVKTGVSSGQKIIFLRACLKEADGSCGSSFQSPSDASFLVLAPPTPTLTPIPTDVPPSPTTTPAPSSYDNIFLSEFMAYPDGGNEWVELFNDNDFEINLFGWSIDDISGSGGSSPISISGTIPANSYKQFYLSSAFLNNSGDDVRLLDGSQTEKDKKSYNSATKGKTWSKDSSGNWCQTDPTPGSSNPNCPLSSVTVAPTPTRTMTVTPTPVSRLVVTPTLSQILNEKEDELAKIMGNKTEEKPVVLGEQSSSTQAAGIIRGKEKVKITAAIFIIGGLVLLGLAGFFLMKEKYDSQNSVLPQNGI